MFPGGDFNGDNRVDQIELNLIGENWLAVKSPAAAAVPEPSSMVLLSIILAALCCRFGRTRARFGPEGRYSLSLAS